MHGRPAGKLDDGSQHSAQKACGLEVKLMMASLINHGRHRWMYSLHPVKRKFLAPKFCTMTRPLTIVGSHSCVCHLLPTSTLSPCCTTATAHVARAAGGGRAGGSGHAGRSAGPRRRRFVFFLTTVTTVVDHFYVYLLGIWRSFLIPLICLS